MKCAIASTKPRGTARSAGVCPQHHPQQVALAAAAVQSGDRSVPSRCDWFFEHSRAPVKAACRTDSAFTLAEVLAALMFMAVVIPVALEALSIASRAGEVAARKGEAMLVAERLLNESIVTTNWASVQNGTVRQGLRDFRYSMQTVPWNEDQYQSELRLLSVEVLYTAQGHEYKVNLSTLVDSSSPFSQTNSSN
jgi:hypothetical protein